MSVDKVCPKGINKGAHLTLFYRDVCGVFLLALHYLHEWDHLNEDFLIV